MRFLGYEPSTVVFLLSTCWVCKNRGAEVEELVSACTGFFPILVGITVVVVVNTYFIIYKGYSRKVNGRKLYEHLGPGYSSLIAWGVGLVIELVIRFTFKARFMATTLVEIDGLA